MSATPPHQPNFTCRDIPGLLYSDHYISEQQEEHLLRNVNSNTKAWKQLNNRSLQNWGGLPHVKGMLPTPLPNYLQLLTNQLSTPDIHFNHVLINKYLPGQGIDAHIDGPAYKPHAHILSLNSPVVMNFYDTQQKHQLICSLLLRPRSLLSLSAFAYNSVYHGIDECHSHVIDRKVLNASDSEVGLTIERKERISLTIRAACRLIKNPLLSSRK